MGIENYERQPIKDGTILKQVTFTDPSGLSVMDENYFMEGNTYRRDLKILKQHSTGRTGGESSTGSTCLVYDGMLGDMEVIVKEFYPDTKKGFFYIERTADEAQELRFGKITEELNQEFHDRKRQFLSGYENQNRYAKEEDLREIVTPPLGLGRYGDTCYIVSPVNQGVTLDTVRRGSWKGIGEKLKVLMHLADLLKLLEKRRLLLLDLAPENLLYVSVSDMVQQIKLFDVDSIVRLDQLEEVHEILFHQDYVWPEITKHLTKGNSFDRQKSLYLIPYAAIYSLGIMAFELLFDHLPSKEELKFGETEKEQMRESLFAQEVSPEIQEELLKLLEKMLCDDRCSADEVLKKLGELQEKLQVQKYQLTRKYDESNYLYFFYNMLQKYPLFRYAAPNKNKEGKKAGFYLDVAIIGSHEMRKQLLRALIPCGQMLDSALTIRLISRDASAFWEEFTSESENPGLPGGVNVFCEKKKWTLDKTLVAGALASIELCDTSDPKEVQKLLKESKPRYLLLLEDPKETGVCTPSDLQKLRYGNKQVFMGFLGNKSDLSEENENWTCLPINARQVLSGYGKNEQWKTIIYQMGLQIHCMYELTMNPRASLKEIEKTSYMGNSYNRNSSERAALHMIYKLASLGITDLESPELLEQLQKKLLGRDALAQENFERLIWLEHKSWSAYELCTGWRRLPMEEFFDIAYENGNTWKDGKGKRHPYLAASRTGRCLKNLSMQNALKIRKKLPLDHLDQVSLAVYEGLMEKAAQRRRSVDAGLEEIDRSVERENDSRFQQDFEWLKNAIEDCYGASPKTNAGMNFEQAVHSLLETLEIMELRTESVRSRVKARVEEICADMRPVLEAIRREDIKISDADVIRSIPQVLMQTQEKGKSKLVLIKPMSKKRWENIYSTLLLRPRTLILAGSQEDESETAFYEKILKNYGLGETAVRVCAPEKLKNLSQNGRLLFDFTGLAPHEVYFWMQQDLAKKSGCFDISDRKLRAWNDQSVEMLPYDVRLTVREVLELTGGFDSTENQVNASAHLTEEQYRQIWRGYTCCNGFRWRNFIRTLNGRQNKSVLEIELTQGALRPYSTVFVYNRVLEETGLRSILEKCSSLSLITGLVLPSSREQGNHISFLCGFEALGTALVRLLSEVSADGVSPIRFCYYLKSWDEEKLRIENRSLFCEFTVPHIPVQNSTIGEYLDDLMERCFNAINYQNTRDLVFQNLKIVSCEQSQGKKISFAYASDAVKDVLKNEGAILEVLIYYECLKYRIFDDIRINSKFYWEGSRVNNEIDIIGTKNNKSYFISVKQAEPKKEFLEEIAQITQHFSLDGQPILVCSNRSTKEDTEETNLVLRSNMMGVAYVGANQIFDEKGNTIIADTIRKIVEETR